MAKDTIDKLNDALIAAGCTNRDGTKVSCLRAQELTGMDNGAILRILKRQRDPTLGTLVKLVDPLGIDVVVTFEKRKRNR